MASIASQGIGSRFLELRASVRKNWWIYLTLVPPFALLTVFTLVPIVQSFLLSFKKWSLRKETWIGLANYERLLTDPVFWKAIENTLIYTIVVVSIGLAIALLLSELIRPLPRHTQTFFKASFYLPSVVAVVVVALVWRWIYNANSYGLLNYLLSFIGMDPVPWLQDSATAFPALMATSLIGGQGASIVLILAAMGNIPNHLYESARLDGSTRFSEFRFITVPLLKPTLLYLTVMNTISSFQVFTGIYLLTNGGPNNSTTTLAFSVYRSGFVQFDFGYASAQAVILFLFIAVFTVILFRFLSDEVEY
ncbi:sugar ABC transporter permease [Phototrophicus methaneseepsis]|uniref:Sugar ABC transporter permease n=1 Tax=Phototrophicus methaneseepsis TaxID=2710758 RepID=A0A7S8EC26_9CHLR|nr:sugar ABC transporter permease [Phototrophicus methaneseepsis]QPC84174.1 sugar ABC transporter permease [Phototrophicus methaneseepsis]